MRGAAPFLALLVSAGASALEVDAPGLQAAAPGSPASAAVDAGAAPPEATDRGPVASVFEIEGVVRGKEGEPLAEARLVLESAARVAIQATDTDQAGRYRLPEIPLGTYELEVTAEGFAPLRRRLEVGGDIHELALALEPIGEAGFRTVVQSQRAPLPAQDATTTNTLTQRDIEMLPGGDSHQLNEVIATGQGVTPDNYGAIHVRGNFSGLVSGGRTSWPTRVRPRC